MRIAGIRPVRDLQVPSVDRPRRDDGYLSPFRSVPHERVAAVSVRERLVLVLPELEFRSDAVHHQPLHVSRSAVLIGRVELEPVHDRIVKREWVSVLADISE